MIELQRYRIVPEALIAVPEHERNLFLAFGSVANEILLLQKLILCSSPGGADEPFLQARLTHSLVLYRLLAGKLHEAWKLLNKAYFAPKLSQAYESDLSPESKSALRTVRKYHSSSNLISKVRNKFAFHFPSDHFDQALRHHSGEELVIYSNPVPANCLFYCSEQLTTVAIIDGAPSKETMETLRRFIDEAITLADYWLKFISGYITLFVSRNRSVLQDTPESIKVYGAPRREEISVSWFIDPDGQAGAPNKADRPDGLATAHRQ